ncbi:MAG: AbiEi antitoxin N-terminal domain-containing protein [Pseudomonadales bacterium]|nr:AbiEi antitoxin N-terminal domain-containing protein [Pseudomonadales bacterium]
MSTEKESKLHSLLSRQPLGTVLVSAWLVENGYSRDLQKRYKKFTGLSP